MSSSANQEPAAVPMPASLPETVALVEPPPGFNMTNVYSILVHNDSTVKSLRATANRQTRNMNRMSKRLSNFENRVLFLERDGTCG